MTIKDLRIMTALSQEKFGKWLGIPLRTIQNWEGNERQPPQYVVDLIEYKVMHEYGKKDE